MLEPKKGNLNYFKIAQVAGAIAGSTLIVALAIKSLFSENISLSILDAQLDISNSKLELTAKATEIQQLSNDTEKILLRLKEANNAHLLATQNLKSCQSRLEEQLPELKKFPRPLPEVVEPVTERELQQVQKELNNAQEELTEEIDRLFEDD